MVGIWALLLEIRCDDRRLGFYVVLSKTNFGFASGQFAAPGVARNPNLPEEIFAAHLDENDLGTAGRVSLLARMGEDIAGVGGAFDVGYAKDSSIVVEDVVTSGISAVAGDEVEWNGGSDLGGLRMSGSGHEQDSQSDESRT
jgi:hypothetical protein